MTQLAEKAEKREAKSARIKDAAFKWDDPLDLEGELTEEERMVRDTARDYAQEKLFPRVLNAYRNEEYDPAIVREMGALGLLGSTIPEEYGGAGLGYVAYGLIAREIERVDSGFRSAMSVQSSLGHASDPCLWQRGAAAQISAQARDSGEFVGCFGLTEPDHGSDPGSMVTRAEKVAGGFRLTGTKTWITNAPVADVAVVWAKLDGKIRGFIVERGTKGFSTPKIEGKLSLRASITGEVVLDGAVVARGEFVAECLRAGRPVRLPQCRARRHRLGRDRRGGILLASRPRLRAHAQAVRPAARRQPAGAEEARRHADRDHARPACGAAAVAADRAGQGGAARVSLLKRNNCGKALEIARVARDMHGGNGIADEFHVMRVMCNLETVNTYEGTHDIHALVLGRAQTGIQAFF